MGDPITFTAIDFETAQGKRHTICQVGLVRIENGKVVHTYESLVKPPGNQYQKILTDEIHGISPEMTKYSPTFDKIWPEIRQYILGQDVVAHNMNFDAGCIRATLAYYDLPIPLYKEHCTMQIFGGSLDNNCGYYDIELDHHNALSDAKACAQLYLLHLLKGLPK